MEKMLILCRSMTHAQRSQRLLERNGIMASVIKAPVHLTRSGCGYGLILRRHTSDAVRVLRDAGMLKGKFFEQVDGVWTEVNHDLS